MPGFSGIPNLAGAVENPLEGIGQGLANAPIQAADQQSALSQKGWQVIQPMILAASRNPNLMSNSAFVAQLQRTAQLYRINGPMIDQAIQQMRAQLGGGQPMMPGGTTSTGGGGGAVQTGPAQVSPQTPGQGPSASSPSQPPAAPQTATSSSQPTTRAVGSQPQLGTHWQDPRLQQLSQIYNQDLEAAARTPSLTGNAFGAHTPEQTQFMQKIMRDGRAVGRTNAQIAADVKAYQLKAGTGPHPEHMPADQAAIRSQRQQALAGGQTTQTAATQPQSSTAEQPQSQAQPQTSAVPPGTPGAGAAGPTTYEGPHALPPAMQGLMAAAGVTPTGMQAYGTVPMDAGTSRMIAEAPPDQRAQLYANAGIDPSTVPLDVMNAKQVITETQAYAAYGHLMTQVDALVKQGSDPSPAIAAAVDMGAMSPDQGQAMMSDPLIVEPLKQIAVSNLQSRLLNNNMKRADYDLAMKHIQAASTTQELQQMRIQYLGKQIQWFDPLSQAKVNQANALVGHYGTLDNADLFGNWYQQNQIGSLSTNQQVTALQKSVNDLQTSYNNLLTTQRTAINNDEDADDVDVGGGVTLSQALANTRKALDDAKAKLNTTLRSAPSKTANSVINPGAGGAKVKQGPRPPGAVPGTLNGKHGWMYPDGTFHPD